MVFGFGKAFVIFLFISVLISWGTKNWQNGLAILAIFAICKVVWNIFTR